MIHSVMLNWSTSVRFIYDQFSEVPIFLKYFSGDLDQLIGVDCTLMDCLITIAVLSQGTTLL